MKYPEIGAVRLAKTLYLGQPIVEWSVWQWQWDGQHHMQARGTGEICQFAKCLFEDIEYFCWDWELARHS